MRKKGRIFYFVDDIETSFVLKDIQFIANNYEQIYLFSIDEIGHKNQLPANVIVIDSFMNWKNYNKLKILSYYFFKIVWIYLFESYNIKRFLPIKKSFALISSNIFKTQEFYRQIKLRSIEPSPSDLFYSFWFYDCIYLAWLKKNNRNLRIVTRTHSGDLYEDHISIRDNLLFRNFQMKYLDAIYPVSNMGTEYLVKKYPKYRNKIKTIFLGTEDRKKMNPFDTDKYVLVSCASFRHHKRIHKIAEALLAIESNVTWYHFGNENLQTNDPKIGEYIENKEKLKLKPNINFIPMGFTPNDKVLDFYTHHAVNLFISLSAAEGIPVSIMEAISFGIPVLSTDVGGCSEIVNENTGILIPLKTSTEEVANVLKAFEKSDKNSISFRIGVREFWLKNFNEDTNYKDFFQEINNIQ